MCLMDIVVWAQEAIFIHVVILGIILDCLGQVYAGTVFG